MERRLTWWFIDKETGNIQTCHGAMVYQANFKELNDALVFIKKLDAQMSREYTKVNYKIEEL